MKMIKEMLFKLSLKNSGERSNMKNVVALCAILILLCNKINSQDITGSWKGLLETPIGKLTIVFHIQNHNDIYSGTMDSPDQQVTGIPASKISFENPNLIFEVSNGAIAYEGILEAGDSMRGTFKQSGMNFPLVLKRGETKAVPMVRPQELRPPFPYHSEEVEFVNPKARGIKFAGTLTLPEKGQNFPAVVMVTGSGPQDRDETLMGHKPFLVIADHLTRRGIAVLRFDDRGTAGSEGNFSEATSADFATDVQAAVQYLRGRKEINKKKIGLIGHSEGGLIAPMVASADKEINFIVLLAGTGYNGKDILLMQNEAILRASQAPESSIENANAVNEKIYRLIVNGGEDAVLREKIIELVVPSLPPSLSKFEKESIAKSQADAMLTPWMKFFLKTNPQDYLKRVRCSVLAINGDKDLQVPAEKNIEAIRKALKEGRNMDVTTKIFPGLNHLFQHTSTGLPSEYQQIEETFAPEALEYIGDWILKRME